MRIITGTLGGRLFDSPETVHTHPMSEKMRGALFNILGDITDLIVLDPFAGSGALSFEAISRGAASAVLIDSDSTAQRTIEQNIKALGVGRKTQLIRNGSGPWLQNNYDETFDLVLCDPPYADLQPTVLGRLARRVNPGGIFVLSYPAHLEAPPFDRLELIKDQNYGDAQLLFYRPKVV